MDKKIILRFLKENNCYNQFLKYKKNYDFKLSEFFFIQAFIWINTDEGVLYWGNINTKWSMIYNYINK